MRILNVTTMPVSNKHDNKPSFGACFAKKVVHYKEWSWNKLKILERSDSEMNDMAEYFHKMSDYELEKIADGNTYFVSESSIQAAYEKLKKAVDNVRNKRSQIEEAIQSGSSLAYILRPELDRLDAKAADSQAIDKLFKK